jgi:hypothetical protein
MPTAPQLSAGQGWIQQNITRPFPNPSATEPPSTTTYSSTLNMSIVSTTATFNGHVGLTDLHTIEADAGPLATLTTTTDAYYASILEVGGDSELMTYGYTAGDSNGSQYQEMLGSGNGELDLFPGSNGATWTNNAALTSTETEPDSTSIADTINADGSYTSTTTFPDPGLSQQLIRVNSDLSASLTNFQGSTGRNISIAAPSGSMLTLSTPTQTVTIADWYPSTMLASDTYTEATSVPFPAQCVLPAGTGTSGTSVTETLTRLDPALGTFQARTATLFYTNSSGLVCAQMHDTLSLYYDSSGQTAFSLSVASAPQQITTTFETIDFASTNPQGGIGFNGPSSAIVHKGASVSGLEPREAFAVVGPIFARSIRAVLASQRSARRSDLPAGPFEIKVLKENMK